MNAPALPGAAPDPAPGRNDPARLPEDVERAAFVAHMASVGVTDVAWPATLGPVGRSDDHYSVMLAVEWERFRAGYRAAIAAHVAPPVSASFDAALAAIDVEATHHTDKMITTHTILGLDGVRAAHRAEVDAIRKERDEARGDARGNYLNILEVTALARTGTGPVKYADPVLEDAAAAVRVLLQERAAHAEAVRVAVEAEREACAMVCDKRHHRMNGDGGGDAMTAKFRAHYRDGASECAAAIRSRGVAKPRTDGEAATRSGEGAKS